MNIVPVPKKEVAVIPKKEVAVIPPKHVACIPAKDVAVIPNKDIAVIPPKHVAVIPNKDVAVIPAKDVAVIPNKDLAVIPNKDVAVIPAKDVAVIPAKEIIALPDNSCKQVANVRTDKSLVACPKLPVCIAGYRLPSACFTCNLGKLPQALKEYVEEKAKLCQPEAIHLCDGSEEENTALLRLLEESGRIQQMKHMNNW